LYLIWVMPAEEDVGSRDVVAPLAGALFIGRGTMQVIIFANGEFSHPQEAKPLLRTADLIIGVDGGTRHALAIGAAPDVIIGDLDSLSPDEQERVEEAGAQIVHFPRRKDETDLELALIHAAHEGATEIRVLAAMGGRIDQTVANVLLLALPELQGCDARIIEGAQEAFLITGDALVEGRAGDTVSLIALGGDAAGVTTEGLEWPLNDEWLRFGPARGISNVLTGEQARVSVRLGTILCVITRGGVSR
jgi:thiamine pyrophosphokinase